MFRSLAGTALRGASLAANFAAPTTVRLALSQNHRVLFSSMQTNITIFPKLIAPNLLSVSALKLEQPSRSVTKFSLNKGKRKSVKAVIKRFKRLDWGAWVRTHTGRQKKLFKKSPALKRRLRQHIFTNSTQSWLLDKMVTSFWRRPKNWIDDPYAPYHKRDEFFATKSKSFKV